LFGIWQKLLFYDTAENVDNILRPHWSLATAGRARVVQALPEMLEILPSGASKGDGVHMLLDHLGANVDEVCLVLLDVPFVGIASLLNFLCSCHFL
jgi:hydroxymethylpyrimidine pyrophosphatase-like HAD family hydrolase